MADKRRGDRFKIWESDRSGLEFGFQPTTSFPNAYTRESGRPVKDRGLQVSPSEFDTPPPSKVPLGGEGDIGQGARQNSDPSNPTNANIIPPESTKNIQYVTAASGIRLNSDPWLYVSGSNQSVNVTVNPQIQAGQQGQFISVLCVGSNILLENGSGLSMPASFNMDSGAILNLMYSRTDNLWHETSRSHLTKDYGRF
jgi:hypothetical protein